MSEIVFIQLRDGVWLAKTSDEWFKLPFATESAQEMLERTRMAFRGALVVLIGPAITEIDRVA